MLRKHVCHSQLLDLLMGRVSRYPANGTYPCRATDVEIGGKKDIRSLTSMDPTSEGIYFEVS